MRGEDLRDHGPGDGQAGHACPGAPPFVLGEQQRQAMQSPVGLPFRQMSLAQQQGFLARALGEAPLRSLDELEGATLRVDYTQPGWFQWQQPGGFDASRWVVRVGSEPDGRRVLMPPIRERTREAALQAARRAFPPPNSPNR